MKPIYISILLFIFIGFSFTACNKEPDPIPEPDIRVTDFDPDLEIIKKGKDTIKIDIDQDNVVDFLFYDYLYGSYNYPLFIVDNSNCFISRGYETDQLNMINSGDTIDERQEWTSNIRWVFFSYIPENNRKYVGVKLMKNDSVFYGWLFPYANYIDNRMIYYIDKMAICTLPNREILAGQEAFEEDIHE